MAADTPFDDGARIGAERELRIVRRVLRDYIRTIHTRHRLVGDVEITLLLDPSASFAPRAVLMADGAQHILLTHGTCWWAYLCARALARRDCGIDWPEAVPRNITRPLDLPADPDTVRTYGEALRVDVPADRDDFFVFLFVTFLCAILFHELAHVLRGHLRLLAASRTASDDVTVAASGLLQSAVLSMLDDGSDDPVGTDVVRRRDLEHDADAVAGFLFGELVLGADALYPLWEGNPPEENLTWALVGYALFCCGIAEAGPSSAAYPDAISRFMAFLYGGRQYAAVRLEQDPDADQALIDCFTVLAQAEDAMPQVADFRVVAEDDGLQARIDEAMEIMDHMPALNRLLSPYWIIPSVPEWGTSDDDPT